MAPPTEAEDADGLEPSKTRLFDALEAASDVESVFDCADADVARAAMTIIGRIILNILVLR
tara:strand:- start:115 stop:297 length:183 start_codon:yes stop_codon:yes gene_type:complete